MHTVMDKNGTAPEVTMGGGQHGGSNMQDGMSAHGAAHGFGEQSAGHTVLDGGTEVPLSGAHHGGYSVNPEMAQGGIGTGMGADAGQSPAFAVKFPDDVPVSQELLDNYQTFCADCGLSNEQAQQAVDFYLKEQARQLDAERDLSMHILQNGAWKGQFEQRLSVANNAVRALDSQLGGRLQPLIEAGLGNNHVFAEMMACVGDLLQEENFIPHAGGGVANRSMSTEDFLRNEVFKTR
ncbi:hypothetical protein [Halodesulfovibrio sp.]|jgi:hypothetical protein|uniref:hypothetical protein n=1 Tax=Halodesulfovibrio sp. TaxID=1912772 RepID=UPI0025EF431F|nr:hypothetical protein [Halodesulfovibrio sp.]MCT4536304.1 hypothetical protein [Halodesulfovibrio sp.]